jgi:peptidoglycan-associated lipoprotein
MPSFVGSEILKIRVFGSTQAQSFRHPIRQMKTLRVLLPMLALILAACSTTRRGGQGGADGDYVSGTPLGTPLPERVEGASFLSANVDRSRFAPVHFGFDSSSVSAGERPKLQTVADFTRKHGSTIIIAGFTDERGTPEYNRGLGERRALTVREELIRMGVNGGRLQTVSFGAEMPADPGSSEGAWAKNRRAEFGLVR